MFLFHEFFMVLMLILGKTSTNNRQIGTGEYFTKKSIFCQGPRQQLSFFAEEIFGIFLIKLPYFWTICDKNA